jgi:hypothetical protein
MLKRVFSCGVLTLVILVVFPLALCKAVEELDKLNTQQFLFLAVVLLALELRLLSWWYDRKDKRDT